MIGSTEQAVFAGTGAPAIAPLPLRIGVDGRVFEPPRTGVGRYVHEIGRALDVILPADTQFFVYARRPVPLPGSAPRWTLRVETSSAWRRLPASAWLLARAGALARRDRLSLFWATATLRPLALGDVPTLATVHDLNHVVAPDTMPDRLRRVHAWRFGPDVRAAAALVANSRGTAARVQAAYGVTCAAFAPPAVAAAFHPPPPAEVARVRAHYGLDAPYFLSVATREPRKNLDVLVAAFRAVHARGTVGPHRLVLSGAVGAWGHALDGLTTGDGAIRMLGYVPDDDLPGLYAGATAFVFPSRYEGFGMPVLEARACGARVITTDVPELREAGGATARYLRPDALADALETALVDAAADRGMQTDSAGARAWTWEDTARVYAEQMTNVVRSRRSP